MKGGSVAFRGAIAFRDREAASRLIFLMADISSGAVEFFEHYDADIRVGHGMALSGQLEEATRLISENFVLAARSDRYKELCKREVVKVEDAFKKADAILSNSYEFGGTKHSDLEAAFDSFFTALQKLMDLNESEVCEAIAKNLELNITAISDLRDKVVSHNIDGLLRNIDQVCPVVLRTMENRLTVTEDSRVVEDLQRLVELMSLEQQEKLKLWSSELDSGNDANNDERRRLCNAIIERTKALQAHISKSIVTSETFKPAEDVEKFATLRSREKKARQTEQTLKSYSIDQVCDLFQSLGASDIHIQNLRQESIDGEALQLLSNEELASELGLPLGVRKKYANFLLTQEKPAAAVQAGASSQSSTRAGANSSKPRPGPKRPTASQNRIVSLRGGGSARGGTIRRRSMAQDAELDALMASMLDGL